jgi:RNA polymerase sigma factor (sigma-70 family)
MALPVPQAPASTHLDDQDDAHLLLLVRAGVAEAYGALYARHAPAARRFAWRLTSSSTSADDLVADAFAAVLAAIGRGHGPHDGFQAYLFTAVRRHAQRGWARNLPVPGGLDPTVLARREGLVEPDDAPEEVALAALERLPPRWRGALQMIEIEGRPLAEVADALGLSPNATSALAYRARRGLREAYLRALAEAEVAAAAAQVSPSRRATVTASARDATPSLR